MRVEGVPLAGEQIQYGARPWAIVIGVDPASAFGERIRRHFPVTEFVSAAEVEQLRQPEFHVAIVVGAPRYLEAHLQVFQFGGTPAADLDWLPGGNGGCPEWVPITSQGCPARSAYRSPW